MRTFKTSKKKCTNYTYYPVSRASITITPDDVGENQIEMLHDDDDATIDADRRDLYHTPYRHDGWNNSQQHARDSSSGADTNDAERLDYMADTAPDPLESIIESIENHEHKVFYGETHQHGYCSGRRGYGGRYPQSSEEDLRKSR